jgi:hypothetical protein
VLGGGSAGTSQTMDGTRGSTAASAAPQVTFKDRENQIGNTLAGRLNDQAPPRSFLVLEITK